MKIRGFFFSIASCLIAYFCPMKEKIIILDFGSQYTQLIARRVRELQVFCEILPYYAPVELDETVKGIILSGSPFSVKDPNSLRIDLPALLGQKPILGICLGHQSIGQAFGGKIVRARQVMHGKTSMIHHRNQGVFKDLKNPFEATRYHSLVIEKVSLPDCLEVTAWTANADGSIDEIMGVRHKSLAIEGVQFHPESILTEHGHDLLRNFITNSP